jgi:dihydroorotate dehydrogenase (fumarate)
VAVKLSQSFTSLPHLVARLEDAGARGVVLFNRFYQPDFDIETLEVRPTLHFSTPSELLPRLHWAAILYGHTEYRPGDHRRRSLGRGCAEGDHGRSRRDDDGFGAAHSRHRAHRQGAGDLRYWLEKREYTSLWETRGCLSRRSVPDTSPFDRGNYIKTLSSYSLAADGGGVLGIAIWRTRRPHMSISVTASTTRGSLSRTLCGR